MALRPTGPSQTRPSHTFYESLYFYEDKEISNKRTIDEMKRGTDKHDEDSETDDEDEARKEAIRHIKKQHNAWMLSMTEAKLRIGKLEGNTYQHDGRTTDGRRTTADGRTDATGDNDGRRRSTTYDDGGRRTTTGDDE